MSSGKRVLGVFFISTQITARPAARIPDRRVWMLWVTAPEATAAARPGAARPTAEPPTRASRD